MGLGTAWRCGTVGGVGLRRATAVLLLVTALVLMALGLLVSVQAASLAIAGALTTALVAFLDVDKITGRG